MHLNLEHFLSSPNSNSSFSQKSSQARDDLLSSLAAQRIFDITEDEDTSDLKPITEYFRSGAQFVDIHVGEMSQSYHLPEALLCAHSTYFIRAFRGHFSEARTKELDFTEIHPLGFEKFVEWILTGQLTCERQHSEKDEVEGDFDHCMSFCALYDFAEYLEMKILQRETVIQIRRCMERSRRLPSQAEVAYVFTYTRDEAPLRTYFVDRMLSSFFEESSFGVTNWKDTWVEATTGSLVFCADVMDGIKEHTILEVCDLKNCTAHKKKNEARDRKLARSQPARLGMGFKVTKSRASASTVRKYGKPSP